jgi:hypothetical protein
MSSYAVRRALPDAYGVTISGYSLSTNTDTDGDTEPDIDSSA